MLKIRIAAAVALTLASSRANGKTTCQATPQGELCISEIDFRTFVQTAYQQQAMSQWCWAAAISMVFSYYHHPVAQPRIVQEVYGGILNMPALAGYVMAQQLNRTWQDDAGSWFKSQLVGAYDPQYGVHAITNLTIVSELDQDHPLILGARGHAVVLTAIQYYRTAQGPYIVNAGAFDPWPGQGARGLYPDELTPAEVGGSLSFAAAFRVSDAPPPANIPPSAGPHVGCSSGSNGPSLAMLAVVFATAQLARRRGKSGICA